MTAKHPLQEGYRTTEDGLWEIIAHHELRGVAPAMIDWWWDHIDNTERYKLWHPTDHIAFEWVVSPATYGHVGAIQRIKEFLNGLPATPVTLEIRWEDAQQAHAEYDHVLVATVSGDAQGNLMHEYQETAFGTRMRSHFHLAPDTPEEIVAALYEHNKQEMHYFTTFLPDLYRAQTRE